jgi:hypothetical protein
MIDVTTGIQGVCAWPNVVTLPNGTLIATIFNQPTHGGWEGDLDCWASVDQGQSWTFRGRPGPHEPATNRMNCAAGLARDGHMIVLVSGWSKRNPPPHASNAHLGEVLFPWVCRSSDEARTWVHQDGAIELPLGRAHKLIPFGTVVHNPDGTLGVSIYGWGDDPKMREALFYVSHDDGRTWKFRSVIAGGLNETTLLVLPKGRLLAAARTAGDQHIELYASDDVGKTWQVQGPLSLPKQIPGHLLRLVDGRIVACYGNRCPNNCGIDARVSQDEGATWAGPIRLANMPRSDGGYPSSAQLADGRIVTAFYTAIPGRNQYEMRVCTWDVNEYDKLK